MSERVGTEVRNDRELLVYAHRLWGSDEYKAWRAHMMQDVADGLALPPPPTSEVYRAEA